MLVEHVSFYGEMLPHIFYGEVSPWVCEGLAQPSPSPDALALTSFLEDNYPELDRDAQNVIDVSFVENVQDDPAVVALFGPTLLSRVDPEYRPR